MSPKPKTRTAPITSRRLVLGTVLLLAASLLAFGSTGPATATGNSGNSGTIKVHEEGSIGEMHNDPHVACPFYFEGFNMVATSGSIVVKAWPPTGNKQVVLTSNWTASDNEATADHHFLAGPYSLASGHYKVFISNAPDHVKMKTFWVECDGVVPPPPCVSPIGMTTYHYFLVGGVNYTSLDDLPLQAGDEVTIVFTLEGCGNKVLSFVSYNATANFNLPDQTVYSSDTGNFTAGIHTMDVIVPPCYYQIDFVFGTVIEHFDSAAGVTYHGQNRFIDGTVGGNACPPPTCEATNSCPPPTCEATNTCPPPACEATNTCPPPSETTTTTGSTTSTGTTGPTSTTQIPVFPSGAAVALGVGGALAATFFVLRRRM